ncbi:hypothetical protein ACHQM5_011450 [Ranunculus cassubicifolius]
MHSPTTGLTPQASVSGSAETFTSQSSPAPVSCVDIETTKSPRNSVTDSVQESGQAKYAVSPNFAGHPPSFSYGVIPTTTIASGSSQETLSAPVMNSPVSDASVQPAVPGPSPETGPSFSYNIVTDSTAGSSNGQQLQSNSANGSGQSQEDKSASPSSESSLQPPAPDVVHSPVPIPKGTPSIAAGFSFGGPSQSPAAVDSSYREPSSYTSTSTSMVQEGGSFTHSSTGLPSVSLPTHPSLSSATINLAATNSNPATPWIPPFPSHPGMVGSPAMPGAPGIRPQGSFTSSITVRTIAPLMPLHTTIPPNSTSQHQIYPPYQLPAMVPHPQAHWLQPPQMIGMQRPPYLPYPAMVTTPFPLPIRSQTIPSLVDSQPPGVSSVGTPGVTLSTSVGSVQHVSISGMQSEITPPGTDHDKKTNEEPVNNGEADAWTAHKSDTGVVYYYNAVTGESTYERPHGFKGEPDKVTAQSTPVSWEKLTGTDWSLVTTDDGKKYYYNAKTKVSSWQIPVEVTEMMKKKQEEDRLKDNTMSVHNASTYPEKGSSSALDLIKRKLQDSGVPDTPLTIPASLEPTSLDPNGSRAVDATMKSPHGDNIKEKQNDANGDGNLSDSSSDSEDAESGPTKEECVIQFKEMLKERGVAPFSKWEKELPKIVFDPRFKAVSSHSVRRSLFEHYVRTRAEEERKEKRAAQKAAVEGFKQLLEEASEDIDHKTDYHSFKKKWAGDSRFEALDRKEREILLNERVLPLRKAAEEKVHAIREAASSSFKSMLRDMKDINPNTRWSRVKDSLRNDPRYKSVKHEDREVLFNEYICELRYVEDEVERAAKAKREEQDKLKQREREMRKRKEREEQEMERVRVKVRRKEAVSSYQALLVEIIRDPQASWTDSKPRLEKDPQGRAINPDLDQADAEKLFRDHVKTLYERCVREFQGLLAEVMSSEAASKATDDGKSSLTSWSTAKRLLKADPRYSKMPRKDRESLWKRYVDEIQRKRKLPSDPSEDRIISEKNSRNLVDSGRSPSGSRRNRDRR